MDNLRIRKVHCGSILIFLLTMIIAILTLLPFVWMLLMSFKTEAEIFARGIQILPNKLYFENYRLLFQVFPFLRFFMNSLVVTVITTALTTIISAMAGYSIARFSLLGERSLSIVTLSSQIIPEILIIIPLFVLFNRLGLLDTYLALVIAYLIMIVPFGTMLLTGFFRTIPTELEEAAMIDGCTRLGALFRVILPLIAPGLVAVSVFTFLVAWNEYLFAVTLLSSTNMFTLPVGISMLMGHLKILWGPLNAAGVVMTIPLVIFFLYAQKYLVQGLTAGAIKG